MKDKQTEKGMGRRTFLKTVGATVLGMGVCALPVAHTPVRPAGAKLPEDCGSCRSVVSHEESHIRPRKLRKLPFYSHIPSTQIGTYQSYVDRAFELSPTLEFEENDPRLSKLMDRAVNNDSLNQLDLELIMIQYVHADEYLREKYRSSWVEKVVNRKDTDFFPDPWTIISAVFDKS